MSKCLHCKKRDVRREEHYLCPRCYGIAKKKQKCAFCKTPLKRGDPGICHICKYALDEAKSKDLI